MSAVGSAANWALVGQLSALSGLVGLFGMLFLPAYLGSTPMPIVVVPVGLLLVLLPRLTYRLTYRVLAAGLPAIVWLTVTGWIYFLPNPLFRRLPVGWQGWQFLLLVGVGSLAAAATIGLIWGEHLRSKLDVRPITA